MGRQAARLRNTRAPKVSSWVKCAHVMHCVILIKFAGTKERATYVDKIRFTNAHFGLEDPFARHAELDDDLNDAIKWCAERSDEQVCCAHVCGSASCLLICSQAISEWCAIMDAIEMEAEGHHRTGACAAWFGDADAIIRKVASCVALHVSCGFFCACG